MNPDRGETSVSKPIGGGYFYDPPKNEGTARISGGPFHAKEYHKKPGIARSLHCHDFYEMEFVASGRGSMRVNGQDFPLSRGTLLLMRPTDVHRYDLFEPMTVLSLRFPVGMIEPSLLPAISMSPPLLAVCQSIRESEALVRCAISEYRTGDAFTPLCLERMIALLLVRLLRAMEPPGHSRPLGGITERAAAYAAAHYAEPITVSSVASALGLSPNHLGKVFADQMKMPLNAYIKRVRLFCAAARIAGTDEPIGTIALECGFSGHAIFSREFKNFWGLTPGDYRQNKTKGDSRS